MTPAPGIGPPAPSREESTVERNSLTRLSRMGSATVRASARGPGHHALVLACLLATQALVVLDAFAVVVALPSIQRQLGASDAGAQLVVAGYMVAYAALLVTGGRLGDLYGRRRLLASGLGAFGLMSLVAALAPSEDVLILARLGQGGAAAMAYPQALGLLQVVLDGRERRVAQALFGVTLGTASAAAPVVGGLIVQTAGWRPIFLINIPITLAAAAVIAFQVPEFGEGDRAPRLDLAGTAALTVGLVALVVPLTVGRELSWPAWAWPLLGLSGLASGAFVLHERRARSPLVAIDLFRTRVFGVGLLTTLVCYAGQVSYFFELTLYLQRGVGLAPTAAGLVFAVSASGFCAAAAVGARLTARVRRELLTVGAVTLACGTAMLALLAHLGPGPQVTAMLPVIGLIGAGFGLLIPILIGVVLDEVPAAHAGAASGVLVTAQQVAGAAGVALGGVLFYGLLPQAGYAGAFGGTLVFQVVLFTATALLVQAISRRTRPWE
jgi:MFS family permease